MDQFFKHSENWFKIIKNTFLRRKKMRMTKKEENENQK